jgi:hypothetical protein
MMICQLYLHLEVIIVLSMNQKEELMNQLVMMMLDLNLQEE